MPLKHLFIFASHILWGIFSRECKAWSSAELHRYGYCESAGDDFDDYDTEEDPAWTTFKSDEEKTIADVVEPLLSFVEEDDFDNMKNRQ